MARLRKAVAYRRLERPYTRISKYRQLSYVRARPASKIAKFCTGDMKTDFGAVVFVVSKEERQIRHNALESARVIANRYLEKNLGKSGYALRIRTYPHHILRENPLATGAGADRMSTGMKMSFGKTVGVAARINVGHKIYEMRVPKDKIEVGRTAARRAISKLPGKYSVVVE